MCRSPFSKLPTIASNVLAIALITAFATSCIPDDPTGPWSLFPGATGSNDTGSTPGVVVVGDSLVFALPVQELANSVRFWSGSSSVVAAAGGASTAHYTKESLISPAGLTTVQNYVSFFQPRITVIALGSNDARILEATAGQSGGYVIQDFQGALGSVIDQGLRFNGCAIVVNVAEHWTNSMLPYIQSVNTNIDAIAAQKGTRARVADWQSHSDGQPWFAGAQDIHHNAAGKVAYRDFITSAVTDAMANGC